MRLYSVYLKNHGRSGDGDMILVKEGFSWPAFVFSVVWALAAKMWLAAIAMGVLFLALSLLIGVFALSDQAAGALMLALAFAIGWSGNDLRRWTLDRQGYDEVAVVSGKTSEDATRRFLDEADITGRGIFP